MKDHPARKAGKDQQAGRSEVGNLWETVTLADAERLSDEELLTALWRRIALTVEEERRLTEGEMRAASLPER